MVNSDRSDTNPTPLFKTNDEDLPVFNEPNEDDEKNLSSFLGVDYDQFHKTNVEKQTFCPSSPKIGYKDFTPEFNPLTQLWCPNAKNIDFDAVANQCIKMYPVFEINREHRQFGELREKMVFDMISMFVTF